MGSFPSMTSNSAFSSPKRYSSGPPTRLTGASHSRPASAISRSARSSASISVRKGCLHRDECFTRVDHCCGNRQSLEHLVRIRSHERTVLERSRFAFRAVRDDVAIAELFPPAATDRHLVQLESRHRPGPGDLLAPVEPRPREALVHEPLRARVLHRPRDTRRARPLACSAREPSGPFSSPVTSGALMPTTRSRPVEQRRPGCL